MAATDVEVPLGVLEDELRDASDGDDIQIEHVFRGFERRVGEIELKIPPGDTRRHGGGPIRTSATPFWEAAKSGTSPYDDTWVAEHMQRRKDAYDNKDLRFIEKMAGFAGSGIAKMLIRIEPGGSEGRARRAADDELSRQISMYEHKLTQLRASIEKLSLQLETGQGTSEDLINRLTQSDLRKTTLNKAVGEIRTLGIDLAKTAWESGLDSRPENPRLADEVTDFTSDESERLSRLLQNIRAVLDVLEELEQPMDNPAMFRRLFEGEVAPQPADLNPTLLQELLFGPAYEQGPPINEAEYKQRYPGGVPPTAYTTTVHRRAMIALVNEKQTHKDLREALRREQLLNPLGARIMETEEEINETEALLADARQQRVEFASTSRTSWLRLPENLPEGTSPHLTPDAGAAIDAATIQIQDYFTTHGRTSPSDESLMRSDTVFVQFAKLAAAHWLQRDVTGGRNYVQNARVHALRMMMEDSYAWLTHRTETNSNGDIAARGQGGYVPPF